VNHAEHRLLERVMKQARISEDDALQLLSEAKLKAEMCEFKSQAVRLKTINFQGKAWTNKSNGDEIWAIIRSNKLITIMFRRSTQPKTCEALRVDNIIF